MVKKCNQCGNKKSVKEFGHVFVNKDGLDYTCRVCHNEREKKRKKIKRQTKEDFYKMFM